MIPTHQYTHLSSLRLQHLKNILNYTLIRDKQIIGLLLLIRVVLLIRHHVTLDHLGENLSREIDQENVVMLKIGWNWEQLVIE